MPPPSWVTTDPLLREAYQHGRTQERLREAAQALIEIRELCRNSNRPAKPRLLKIEVTAALTLERLSASCGGVIDDLSPLTPARQTEDAEPA